MRFILERCELIHLGKTNPKHSMRKHSAEHKGGLPPSGLLRGPSQEITCAASDFFLGGWSQRGQQGAGDLDIWEPQARFIGDRGLRSPLPSWMDSDLVVQGGEERSTPTIDAVALPTCAQASTQWALRITPHKTSLGLWKSSFLQVAQYFKYSGAMGH